MAILKVGWTSYKLKRHPAYKTDSAPLKTDIQTQAQFMKINEVSVREFKWKSSYFLGVGVDPCMLGKCLTDTWLKCVEVRKNNSLLPQLVSFLISIRHASFQRNP